MWNGLTKRKTDFPSVEKKENLIFLRILVRATIVGISIGIIIRHKGCRHKIRPNPNR